MIMLGVFDKKEKEKRTSLKMEKQTWNKFDS